jgi:hypothetical protein
MSQSLKLIKQLEKACGQTQHVVALIFDIRGFTNFCKNEGDPVNISNFIKRIYIKTIQEDFPDATYYKPTGDGLLVIFSCGLGKEAEITNSVVERAVKLVKEFPTLCKGDKLVYFKTPSNIGIGISRGSACCISSEGEIVDFSGKPLNLAARLSDAARPLGVVFDESVSSCIPTEDLAKNYVDENIYVKGLAEEESIKVYHTKETIISSAYKRPINEPEWVTDLLEFTFEELTNIKAREFEKTLSKTPLDDSQIILRMSYVLKGGKRSIVVTWKMDDTPNIYYTKVGKEHTVSFNIAYVVKQILEDERRPDLPVKFELIYPVKT